MLSGCCTCIKNCCLAVGIFFGCCSAPEVEAKSQVGPGVQAGGGQRTGQGQATVQLAQTQAGTQGFARVAGPEEVRDFGQMRARLEQMAELEGKSSASLTSSVSHSSRKVLPLRPQSAPSRDEQGFALGNSYKQVNILAPSKRRFSAPGAIAEVDERALKEKDLRQVVMSPQMKSLIGQEGKEQKHKSLEASVINAKSPTQSSIIRFSKTKAGTEMLSTITGFSRTKASMDQKSIPFANGSLPGVVTVPLTNAATDKDEIENLMQEAEDALAKGPSFSLVT